MSNSIPEKDKYHSLQESAKEWNLSYWQLRNAVLDGDIPYIKSGNKYLVREGALREYLSHMEQIND